MPRPATTSCSMGESPAEHVNDNKIEFSHFLLVLRPARDQHRWDSSLRWWGLAADSDHKAAVTRSMTLKHTSCLNICASNTQVHLPATAWPASRATTSTTAKRWMQRMLLHVSTNIKTVKTGLYGWSFAHHPLYCQNLVGQ